MDKQILGGLIKELQAAEIDEWRVVYGGKHPQLQFEYGGRICKVVFPSTASDRRSGANTVAFLRRLLRPEQPARTVSPTMPCPRRRKRVSTSVSKLPTSFAVKPNPWLALGALRDRMVAQAEAAAE